MYKQEVFAVHVYDRICLFGVYAESQKLFGSTAQRLQRVQNPRRQDRVESGNPKYPPSNFRASPQVHPPQGWETHPETCVRPFEKH